MSTNHTNRQQTLDDIERVIPRHAEAVEVVTATRKYKGEHQIISTAGKQLYEKIEEQKELEALIDPYFDY